MLQSRGTGSSRRSNACWTCKLRRKKCDEAHPACTACVSRTITCHGYDLEKPQWMDGATREREELERIQIIVKENKRTQRKLQFRQKATQRQDDLPIQVDQSVAEELSPRAAVLLTRPSQQSRIGYVRSSDKPLYLLCSRLTRLPKQSDWSNHRLRLPGF